MLSKLIDLLSNSLYSAKPQYDDGDITTAKRSVLISLFRKRGFKRVPPVMAQDLFLWSNLKEHPIYTPCKTAKVY